ncbi:dihydroorotase [Fructilactobacillus fructivorans]|nr:dihydroorotase [Fructilactobacillus fructivorans]
MIIKQGYIENSKQKQDLLIKDGKIKRIANHIDDPEEKVIDANGKLIIPPFVDSHVHLDSTLTSGEPRFNESGTLFEGISIWADRKKSLSAQDVKSRAIQTLKNQAKHGIQFVRSHVDTTDPNFTAP